MAKYSNSLTELTREVTQQTPRARALMMDIKEDPANKKVVSVMYLSLGEVTRKQFKNKYPNTTLWDLKTADILRLTNESFQVKRNRTLDYHQFFSRLQQSGESLHQFWHVLNGLAAPSEFGRITTMLGLDIFILHMNNKKRENYVHKPKNLNRRWSCLSRSRRGLKDRGHIKEWQ